MTRKKDNRTTRLPVPAGQLPAFTPVPRQCQRHDGWTPERQHAFIEALADTGSVKAAARAVNMSPEGAYLLRRQPGADSFRAAWTAALDLGVQQIEDIAMERALHGIDVPVYSYGKLVGTRRVYNDRLMMFMLRNRAPDRFAEGKPKAMNALDKSTIARLKKQWRKEYAREHAIAQKGKSNATLERLTAKIDKARENMILRMSPRTRAAWDRYQELSALDEAEGYQWWTDPDHSENLCDADADSPGDDGADDDTPDDDDTSTRPPGWRRLALEPPKPEQPPASTVRTIKGDAIWKRE